MQGRRAGVLPIPGHARRVETTSLGWWAWGLWASERKSHGKQLLLFLQKARLKNLSHCNTLPFSEPAMMRHPLAMDTYDSDTETSEDEDFTRVINDYDYSTLMPCNVCWD